MSLIETGIGTRANEIASSVLISGSSEPSLPMHVLLDAERLCVIRNIVHTLSTMDLHA